jgi:RNA polymerase sigma-54 factor
LLLRQTLKQTLAQKIDPKLILANSILGCSTLELMDTIEQELADNPALERPEDDICANCSIPRDLCAACPYNQSTREAADVQRGDDWTDWYAPEVDIASEIPNPDEPDYDRFANVYSEHTLHDHLLDQLRSTAAREDFEIGEYMVGSINNAGYFEGDLDEMAAELQVDTERLHAVLAVIQSFDPPGVGARSLQECLILQLASLNEQGEGNELAMRMIRDLWPDTSARKVTRLANQLKVPRKVALATLDFIRDRLRPYPGEGFRAPWDTNPENLQTVEPDVVVRRTVAGYEIEVVVHDYQALSISSKYREAYASIRNGGSADFSEDERRHIVEYVERADSFIRSILQRRKTLKAITRYVVEFQQGYIETGQRPFLRPLTRTQVARSLNMHESTISRATANKWLQLPSEEVVSYDLFFDSSMGVKDLIEEIIASEDKARPLSDQDIAEMLQERGLNVARRTVVKYREAQNILSSRRRRAAARR